MISTSHCVMRAAVTARWSAVRQNESENVPEGCAREMNEPTKVPGNLNLPRLFQAEALSLLEAVERGKLLHGTKNIRDSGGPLEARLRGLLSDRMPSGVQIAKGYLYDVDSDCTPQIDAMLLASADNHSMMTTEDGAVYAPFASALVILEIKSSIGDVSRQLEQTCEIVSRIKKMGIALRERSHFGSGSTLPNPISVLFYASSSGAKLKDFQDWHASHRGAMPTYVVFLDRACILTARNFVSEVFDFGEGPSIGFSDYLNPASICLCSSEIQDEHRQGRVLLWLYFSLLNVATRSAGTLRPASDFIGDAVRRYQLQVFGELETAVDWPTSLMT